MPRGSCFIHDWKKWESYVDSCEILGGYTPNIANAVFAVEETRQRRECKRCGFMEDRKLKDGPDGFKKLGF